MKPKHPRLIALLLALCVCTLFATGCRRRSEYSHSVTYKVWSNAPKADTIKADIVYMDDSGSQDRPDTRLPWTTTVEMENFPTASLRAGTSSGTIQMSIAVDGKVVCEQNSDTGTACEYKLRPG